MFRVAGHERPLAALGEPCRPGDPAAGADPTYQRDRALGDVKGALAGQQQWRVDQLVAASGLDRDAVDRQGDRVATDDVIAGGELQGVERLGWGVVLDVVVAAIAEDQGIADGREDVSFPVGVAIGGGSKAVVDVTRPGGRIEDDARFERFESAPGCSPTCQP